MVSVSGGKKSCWLEKGGWLATPLPSSTTDKIFAPKKGRSGGGEVGGSGAGTKGCWLAPSCWLGTTPIQRVRVPLYPPSLYRCPDDSGVAPQPPLGLIDVRPADRGLRRRGVAARHMPNMNCVTFPTNGFKNNRTQKNILDIKYKSNFETVGSPTPVQPKETGGGNGSGKTTDIWEGIGIHGLGVGEGVTRCRRDGSRWADAAAPPRMRLR